MTNLNFYPYYEQLLRRKEKYATVRLGDRRSAYHVGDVVTITIGWNEKNESDITPVCKAQIIDVIYKPVKDIREDDLEGESPDCYSKESLPYVLSAIYRKVVTENDFVTIIRWKYLR
jgi:hypothetical protein